MLALVYKYALRVRVFFLVTKRDLHDVNNLRVKCWANSQKLNLQNPRNLE